MGADDVVNRLMTETRITLREACRLFGVHGATGRRWCTRGVLLPDGRRVFLEHLRVGARRLTTAEAVKRFLAAQLGSAEPACRPV